MLSNGPVFSSSANLALTAASSSLSFQNLAKTFRNCGRPMTFAP